MNINITLAKSEMRVPKKVHTTINSVVTMPPAYTLLTIMLLVGTYILGRSNQQLNESISFSPLLLIKNCYLSGRLEIDDAIRTITYPFSNSDNLCLFIFNLIIITIALSKFERLAGTLYTGHVCIILTFFNAIIFFFFGLFFTPNESLTGCHAWTYIFCGFFISLYSSRGVKIAKIPISVYPWLMILVCKYMIYNTSVVNRAVPLAVGYLAAKTRNIFNKLIPSTYLRSIESIIPNFIKNKTLFGIKLEKESDVDRAIAFQTAERKEPISAMV